MSEKKAKTIPAEEVFVKLRKQPGYAEAYAALDEEFAILSALIKARTAAGLSQTDLARRMKTTQSAIARLEAGWKSGGGRHSSRCGAGER